MRPLRSCLPIIVGFALIACSRSETTPSTKDELAAVPLGMPLVTRMSDLQTATTGSDSIRAISFAGVPWSDSIEYGDIEFICSWEIHTTYHGIHVVDPRSGAWVEIRGALPDYPGGCYAFGGCFAQPRRFLSQEFGASPNAMLDNDNAFRIAGLNTFGYQGRIIEYDPVYDFAIIRYQEDFGARPGLRVYADSILLYSTFDDPITGVLIDSVLTFDRLGVRRSGYAMPRHFSWNVTIGDEGFWYATGGDDDTLVYMDHFGNDIHRFRWAQPSWPRRIAAQNGKLWVIPGPYWEQTVIEEINIDASVAIGEAVISRSDSTEALGPDLFVVVPDGYLFVKAGNLLRLDSAASIIETTRLNVNWPTAIAYEGGDLWISHHGPTGTYTDATLLSRFKLE